MFKRNTTTTYPLLIQPHTKSSQGPFKLTLTKAASLDPESLTQLYNYDHSPYQVDNHPKKSSNNLVLLSNKDPIAILLNKTTGNQQLEISRIIVHPMYPEETIVKACHYLLQGFYARSPIDSPISRYRG